MTRSRVPRVIGIGSAVIGAAALLSAQDPGRPSFKVASVKPHRSVEQTSGGGRGPDRAEPLGEDGERAGRDVPIVGRGDHVLDRPDLGGRQSRR